ncbi:jg25984 [Pararge aegeria aegeria]|uniref:Jg25984 protein n=1 Tax=Pararge aegeria aegeria TaxID=348720 RepID=A0A8S4RD37_9NEOP|nr:jg25984 [Pararge aegeria aegeria]
MLMVQSNAHPMKTTKIKGPPPVPPRPSQSMVAEALAKTRKAVADSKATVKTRTFTKNEIHHVSSKAKTLDRNATPTKPSVSPRQNGLARVKSFIKDVISDRSSSSDEKKSSGHNSRRSSSDSSSIHSPASNKSSESLNSKAVKTCKQILVRSLSTSNRLDQDQKCKVSKSSSFAEKTLPLRKAPPPPLSPKPKLKPMKPLPVQKSVEQKKQLKQPDTGIYALPVDAQLPQSTDDCYATIEEVQKVEDRLQNSSPKHNNSDTQNIEHQLDDMNINKNNNNNSLERKTSRVTEMLISEILASRNNNKGEANAVIDKGKDSTNLTNGNESPEVEKMKDMNNHEMLIYELQTMRSQSNVPEGLDAKEIDDMQCDSEDENYTATSVTSENIEDDQAYAYIRDDDLKSRLRKQFRAISTMSLQGMPPLPKSLSGFADGEPDLREPPLTPAEEHPPTDLDSQLIYLKKEMFPTVARYSSHPSSFQNPSIPPRLLRTSGMVAGDLR